MASPVLTPNFFASSFFGEDDAVPRLGIARHRHRVHTERGVEKARHRGVEAVKIRVEIRMKNSASHRRAPFRICSARGRYGNVICELMFVYPPVMSNFALRPPVCYTVSCNAGCKREDSRGSRGKTEDDGWGAVRSGWRLFIRFGAASFRILRGGLALLTTAVFFLAAAYVNLLGGVRGDTAKSCCFLAARRLTGLASAARGDGGIPNMPMAGRAVSRRQRGEATHAFLRLKGDAASLLCGRGFWRGRLGCRALARRRRAGAPPSSGRAMLFWQNAYALAARASCGRYAIKRGWRLFRRARNSLVSSRSHAPHHRHSGALHAPCGRASACALFHRSVSLCAGVSAAEADARGVRYGGVCRRLPRLHRGIAPVFMGIRAKPEQRKGL